MEYQKRFRRPTWSTAFSIRHKRVLTLGANFYHQSENLFQLAGPGITSAIFSRGGQGEVR